MDNKCLLNIGPKNLGEILTRWLSLQDLSRLDSAVCSQKHRTEFLSLLASKEFLFLIEEIAVSHKFKLSTTAHRYLEIKALDWIRKRGLHLGSLRLPSPNRINEAENEKIRAAVASLVDEGRLDKLETIDFNKCYYIKDSDLAALLSKCYGSLKILDIGWCSKDTLFGSYASIQEWRLEQTGITTAQIQRCKMLQAFSPMGNESEEDLIKIVKSCTNMRKLDFSPFGDIVTSAVVRCVAAHCHLLEHVNVAGFDKKQSNKAIRKLVSCPLLQYVDLSKTRITDETVRVLSNHCPLLETIILSGCPNVTSAGLELIASNCVMLKNVVIEEPLLGSRSVVTLRNSFPLIHFCSKFFRL